jgi:hypothetical protein
VGSPNSLDGVFHGKSENNMEENWGYHGLETSMDDFGR